MRFHFLHNKTIHPSSKRGVYRILIERIIHLFICPSIYPCIYIYILIKPSKLQKVTLFHISHSSFPSKFQSDVFESHPHPHPHRHSINEYLFDDMTYSLQSLNNAPLGLSSLSNMQLSVHLKIVVLSIYLSNHLFIWTLNSYS